MTWYEWRLLKNVEIQALISERIDEKAMTADEVLMRLVHEIDTRDKGTRTRGRAGYAHPNKYGPPLGKSW